MKDLIYYKIKIEFCYIYFKFYKFYINLTYIILMQKLFFI